MIAVAAGLRVLVASKPVDFRKGADGLAALVREAHGEDPFSGTIFVFRCKRADRVKFWRGTGPAWCCSGNDWSTGPSGGRRSAMA